MAKRYVCRAGCIEALDIYVIGRVAIVWLALSMLLWGFEYRVEIVTEISEAGRAMIITTLNR